MLAAVFHKSEAYLKALLDYVHTKNSCKAAIVRGDILGASITGPDAEVVFSCGRVAREYDKAFIAQINEDQAEMFMELVKRKDILDAGANEKGFLCTVPFGHIDEQALEGMQRLKQEDFMKIGDVLRLERINLELDAPDKESAIKKTVELLRGAKEVVDFDGFLKDLFEREALKTTGIGEGIAIPHARTTAVKGFVIAFARVPGGLEFAAVDGKPVQLIFLMGTPKNEGVQEYLKILAHLTRLLSKEGFAKSLLCAASAEEVRQVFAQAEK